MPSSSAAWALKYWPRVSAVPLGGGRMCDFGRRVIWPSFSSRSRSSGCDAADGIDLRRGQLESGSDKATG